MNLLVTGSDGFIGKNLISTLNHNIVTFDRNNESSELKELLIGVDFVIHLAGVNRSKESIDFYHTNTDLTELITKHLRELNNKAPIIFASSIHAGSDSDFGISKKQAEEVLLKHADLNESKVFIYRLPNLYGKWSRPNYNSVVATWCHNISRDIPIEINNPTLEIEFAYIDDVVNEFLNRINQREISETGFYEIQNTDTVSLGELAEILYSFKQSRNNFLYPDFSTNFKHNLYSTYLSYMPEDQFSYPLKMNTDHRGSFTEILKSEINGQVSVNISKPGITKGQHWHHTKNEKFLVVSGVGVIRFRNIFNDEVIEYHVSGETMEVVDIPPGYTHNIENLGDTNLVTIMWANELFDVENPDTYYLEV